MYRMDGLLPSLKYDAPSGLKKLLKLNAVKNLLA